MGLKQYLIKPMRLKFGNLPNGAEEIVIQADKTQLDQWVERILFANSLDELLNP